MQIARDTLILINRRFAHAAMILILDHYDSFTHNLDHQVRGLGRQTQILQSAETSIAAIESLGPSMLILSAGPKTPAEFPLTLEAITYFKEKLPILGVCLGHQALGVEAGANLTKAKELIHGQSVPILFEESRLFQKIKAPFRAAKYNSLILEDAPEGYKVVARDKLGEIMAIEHESLPIYGVQFHLESFMSKQGTQIMRNFLHANQ